MMHWMRYLFAAVTCLVGGAVFTLALVLAIQHWHSGDDPSAISLSIRAKSWLTFFIVFCSIHLSSRLTPVGSRRYSSLFSGTFLVFCFLGIVLAIWGKQEVIRISIPILRDLIPFVGATLLSWYVHVRNDG